ncbi:MAG: hypothetical protein D6748_02520 [Calditrichaeota bacterium]|nr:MAG: hypothetical protein D6748_02520 [Calditrichota bacterium]
MRRLTIILISFFLLTSGTLFAQYRSQETLPDIKKAIASPTSSILGLFNPEKLHMSHSLSMSYFTLGGHGVMLNSYVNTIDYQFNPALSFRLNLGLMNSPYNSLPNASVLNNTQFFGSGELKYQPSDKLQFRLGVGMAPNFYPYYLNPGTTK